VTVSLGVAERQRIRRREIDPIEKPPVEVQHVHGVGTPVEAEVEHETHVLARLRLRPRPAHVTKLAQAVLTTPVMRLRPAAERDARKGRSELRSWYRTCRTEDDPRSRRPGLHLAHETPQASKRA